MEETVRHFSTTQQQLDLHLEEIGHFDNKVIYARVKKESEGVEHLNHLSKSLRDGCQTAGITLIDGDRFTPHVTLLKMSNDTQLYRKVFFSLWRCALCENCLISVSFSQGIKAVASHLYEKHVDCIFGRQVTNIHAVQNQLIQGYILVCVMMMVVAGG